MDLPFNEITNLNSMPQKDRYDVIIIGGGPAGASAAIYTSRAGLSTIVLDKGLTTGALGITGKIVNYPGISGEIGGAQLLTQIREQAISFGSVFQTERVIGVDFSGSEKQVFGNNGMYTAKIVIIATGSMGRGQRVKGEDQFLGHGVSYCATCDGAFFRDQDVLVAGNSDEAVEEALFLTRFAKKVYFLSPTPELKVPDHLAEELLGNPKIVFFKGAAVREIQGNSKVEGVRFGLRGEDEQYVPVNGVFIYLQGAKPITDFLQGQLEISESGCLMVDHEYQTTNPGVFAIGDVLCNHMKQAVVAASEGAIAAMAAEKAIHQRKQMIADWSK